MSDKIFHIQSWTPRVREVAEALISRIHAITPELEVLFMGAAALGLPGKNGIDLDIICDTADIALYTQRLISVLGEPKEMKDKLTAWEFELDGFEIDAILSDPKISHVPLQRKRFEVLKENPKLLDEYKELKIASDGLPYDEYEQRKLTFLEEKVFSSKA
jgi:hypothetical protein